MRITEITVSAGRVIPHPRESCANLRPMLTLKATVEEGETVAAVVAWTQAQAETLLSAHIDGMLTVIEAKYQAERKREDEAYEQRQRERLAASAGGNADALDDDEIDDNEDITSDDVDAMDEEDEEIPFEAPGR
jgi:hypothetical protein